MSKIVIGTPNFTSDMDTDVAFSMARNIRAWSKNHDIHWLVVKRSFICKARSQIVQDSSFLKADYLFWIDDDALVNEDTLERFLVHDKNIVITPYPMRRPPYQCGVLKTTDGNIEDQTSYKNLDWNEDMNKGLVEVDGGGTHAMLTKMHIYGPPSYNNESLEDYIKRCPGKIPYPWFVLAPFGGTEDMYMCLMARRCGLKIYCDTDIESGHVGYREVVTSGNFKAWTKKFGKQTKSEVLEKLPEGSLYIDVNPAGNSGVMPTTLNTPDVGVDVEDGQVQEE